VEIPLTLILQTTTAFWANLKGRRELIESNGWDTLLYNLKDIFICTIKEQCSDNENIHETDRTTVKTLYLILYGNVTGYIMRICLWQNERQRSINDFWPCRIVTQNAR
jgi:hypothetical protein